MTESADRSWRQRFIVEERYLPATTRRRMYLLASMLIAVGLLGFAALLWSVLTFTGFQRLDVPVESWFNSLRSADATASMIVLAIVFGPTVLPLVILAVLIAWVMLAKHLWRPLLLAGGMVTGMLLAMVIAPLVQHPRPPIGLMLFGPDHSFSFPSGHVLGTADFLLLLAYLLASRIQRRWFTVTALALAIIGILAQICSRLYLGYHWISDTTASLMLSMVIVGTVMAIDVKRTVRVPGERILDPFSQLQRDGT
ncbi:phosphatase PAP2 family protein [Microbacteriaceae bacterium VKM Ac-2854]|nr:phosphatase PAP2 family protein [Microbacteriaceae bacterium VKM Ac-2854]